MGGNRKDEREIKELFEFHLKPDICPIKHTTGMRTLEIKTEKTARVIQLGPQPENARSVLIALHGYGQLASDFAQPFEEIAQNDVCVVVPKALHRFYLRESAGTVGASWMTREARETDIADYVQYLNQVLISFKLDKKTGKPPLSILGFSQGASTAVRWVCQGNVNPTQLILWAGSFPPDLKWPEAGDKLRNLPITYVWGDEDKYVTPARFEDEIKPLCEQNIPFKTIRFHGGHRLHRPLIGELL